MRSRGLVRLIHRLEVGVSELAYVCTKTNFSHHQFVNIVKIVQSLSFSSSRFAEMSNFILEILQKFCRYSKEILQIPV